MLCGATATPLIAAGFASGVPGAEVAAVTGVVGSVGSGVLSAVLLNTVDRLRARAQGAPPPAGEVEEAVIDDLERALVNAQSEDLERDIADLFQEIDAGEIVVRASLDAGDPATYRELITALGRLGDRFSLVLDVLVDGITGVLSGIGEIRQSQARQTRDIVEISADIAEIRELLDGPRVPDSAGAAGTRPARSRRGRWSRTCPYLGLRSFDEFDASVFYGREKMTAELADRMIANPAGGIVIVTGPSGAGKTSLLRAGLLPMLRRGEHVPGSNRWLRCVLTPGEDPLGQLAWTLATFDGRNPSDVRSALAGQPAAAQIVVQQAVDRYMLDHGRTPQGGRMVLILDQFEQAFAPDVGQANVADFIAALHSAATLPVERGGQPPALIAVAVRADFLQQCFGYEELSQAVKQGLFVVEPMNDREFRQAITRPAANGGLRIEEDLVEQILSDVRAANQGGVLPLLSEAMRLTWTNREGDWLTSDGYEKGGGVAGAVQRSADKVYGSLDTVQQPIARDILIGMTAIAQDGQLTRRSVDLADITAAHPGGEAEAVLGSLAEGRLIVLDKDRVQLVHDALLTAWPRLQGWLNEDRQNIILHAQLKDDAEWWRTSGKDPDYLYRGSELGFFQKRISQWSADHRQLAPVEREFLDTSERADVRAARLRRSFVGLLAVLLVASITGAIVIWRAAVNADRQSSLAVSGQLATLSEEQDGDNPGVASLLAAAAWEEAQTNQAREALLDVLAQPVSAVLTDGSPIRAVAFSPAHGGILATAGGVVQLRSLATHRPLGPPIIVPGGAKGAAFNSSGRILATADADGTVRLWDVATHREVGLPFRASGSNGVNAVAFNPAGTLLATADGDNTVRLWNVAAHRQVGHALIDSGPAILGNQMTDVQFSPSGRLLATADLDGTARLWKVTSQRQIGQAMTDGDHLTRFLQEMIAVAFSPRGNTLATASRDGTVALWDVATQHRIATPFVATEGAKAVAFSPNGKILAVAEGAGAAQLWDVVTREEITPALTAPAAGAMSAVTFNTDASVLVTVSADGSARLWDLTRFRNFTPAVTLGSSSGTAFRQDGTTLATVTADGAVRMWNLVTGRETGKTIPISATGGVSALAFSPDGRILATGDDDGNVRLWNPVTGREAGKAVPVSATGGVSTLAFSPDGRILATGDDDGTIRLWNLITGHPDGSAIPTGSATVSVLAFSPDGTTLAAVDDGKLRLVDVITRRMVSSPVTVAVDEAAFGPDGSTLATADDDGTARLWNLRTGQQVGAPMPASVPGEVADVVFSPDGTLLATAGDDGTARLWDVATQRQIGPEMLGGTASGLDAVAFSSDGSALATVGPDGTATLWDVAFPRDLLGAVCSIAGRSLTRQEWATYVSAPYLEGCP